MADYDFEGLMTEDTPITQNKYDFSGLMEDDVKKVTPTTKKEAWKISTPEELVDQGFTPTQAGLIATGQELTSPAYKYGNMLLGGLPNIALGKMGYRAPEADLGAVTPAINAAANIGGFVRGIPMQIGGVVARGIPQATRGAGLLTKAGLGAARGATQFGIGSGLQTPEREFENWKARGLRTVAGGVAGAVTGGVSGLVEHFTGLLSQKALLGAGRQVRESFKGFEGKLKSWFGDKLLKFQYASPKTKVDLTTPIKAFKTGVGDKTKFKALLNASPRLKKAIESKQLSLYDTQELVNQLKNTISESQLAGFKVRPNVGEVKKFISLIQEQKHLSFPGMRYTDKVYGVMSDYTNAIENYTKFGRTVQGIRSMVKNPEMRKSLQIVLPKDVFETVIQTAKAQTITKEGLRAVDYLVRYGILYAFMKKVMNKATPESAESTSGGNT